MGEIFAGIGIIFAIIAPISVILPIGIDDKVAGMIKKREPWELIKIEIQKACNTYIGVFLIFFVAVYQYIIFVFGIDTTLYLKSLLDIKIYSGWAISVIFFVLGWLKRVHQRRLMKKYKKECRKFELNLERYI